MQLYHLFHNQVCDLVVKGLQLRPSAVEVFVARLSKLKTWTEQCMRICDGLPVPILNGADFPMVRLALLKWRRQRATELELPRSMTTDREVIQKYDTELHCIKWLLNQPELNIEPVRMPCLTDYMSIQHAEKLLNEDMSPPDRVYDQKFQILLAPQLINEDLEYYRRKCELRDLPLSLAFLDIDEFKQYNTEHTHAIVDLDLLPQFQQAIEAHMYCRGQAYIAGGDEYILLLPNMSEAQTQTLLEGLQSQLASVKYRLPKLEKPPTISAGYVTVLPDSIVTTREIRELANSGVMRAKENGRNQIVNEPLPKFV